MRASVARRISATSSDDVTALVISLITSSSCGQPPSDESPMPGPVPGVAPARQRGQWRRRAETRRPGAELFRTLGDPVQGEITERAGDLFDGDTLLLDPPRHHLQRHADHRLRPDGGITRSEGPAAHANLEAVLHIANETVLAPAHDVVKRRAVSEHDAEQLAIVVSETKERERARPRVLDRVAHPGAHGVELDLQPGDRLLDQLEEERFLG